MTNLVVLEDIDKLLAVCERHLKEWVDMDQIARLGVSQ